MNKREASAGKTWSKALCKITPFCKPYFLPANLPEVSSWSQHAFTLYVGNTWTRALCRGCPCSKGEERFKRLGGFRLVLVFGFFNSSSLCMYLHFFIASCGPSDIQNCTERSSVRAEMDIFSPPVFLNQSKLSGSHSWVHPSSMPIQHPHCHIALLFPPVISMETDSSYFVQSRATRNLNEKRF